MPTVHIYKRFLLARPESPAPAGYRFRCWQGVRDIEHWLALRQLAFEAEQRGVGQWNLAKFQAEFLSQPWWRPDRLWFAEPADGPPGGQPVGTIALAQRGVEGQRQAVIHWLSVAPEHRRKGVALALVRTAEAAAWDDGHRRLMLQTHASWHAANRFYLAAGYECG